METWYLVSKYADKAMPVEVGRTSEKCLWIKCGSRSDKVLKRSSYEEYFETEAEALKVLSARKEAKEKKAKMELVRETAPDLLEALISITKYPDVDKYVGRIIFDKAKAAIEKATTPALLRKQVL